MPNSVTGSSGLYDGTNQGVLVALSEEVPSLVIATIGDQRDRFNCMYLVLNNQHIGVIYSTCWTLCT